MSISNKFREFKSHNEAKNQLEVEIVKDTKNLIDSLNIEDDFLPDYHVDILNDTLIIAFKTNVIDFAKLDKLNQSIGLEGQLGAKKNSNYCLRLCYHL